MNHFKFFICCYCCFAFYFTKAQSVFSEKFDDTLFLRSWNLTSKIEHAYFLGTNNSRYVRFHPKFQNEFIQTPIINLATGNYKLFFDWNESENSNPDSVQIQLSLNAGSSWQTLKSITGGNNRIWQKDSVDLGNKTGTIIVRWKYFSSTTFPSQYFNLDNVSINQYAVTALKQNKNVLNFAAFPNPATGKFTLQLNNLLQKSANLKIIDINGTLVKYMSLNSSFNFTSEIDISNFAKGAYIISVETDENIFTQPLIIQ